MTAPAAAHGDHLTLGGGTASALGPLPGTAAGPPPLAPHSQRATAPLTATATPYGAAEQLWLPWPADPAGPGAPALPDPWEAARERAEAARERAEQADPGLPGAAGPPAPGWPDWHGEETSQQTTAGGTGWVSPVPEHFPVSAPYRMPGGWAAGYHTGVDFAVPPGTPLAAIGPGTVASAGYAGDYGNAVVLRMADGHYVLYAHLSSVAVERGQAVSAGDHLGASGNTGRSTGPHLHFEVRADRAYGTDVDPLAYLAERGVFPE